MSDSTSDNPTGVTTPAGVDTPTQEPFDPANEDPFGEAPPAGIDSPEQDFSITESCEEIRAEYMAAEPGSDEERWALEAAEEVCFSQ